MWRQWRGKKCSDGICINKPGWAEVKWISVPPKTTVLRSESESLSSWREKRHRAAWLERSYWRPWFVSRCGLALGRELRPHWKTQNGQQMFWLHNFHYDVAYTLVKWRQVLSSTSKSRDGTRGKSTNTDSFKDATPILQYWSASLIKYTFFYQTSYVLMRSMLNFRLY